MVSYLANIKHRNCAHEDVWAVTMKDQSITNTEDH